MQDDFRGQEGDAVKGIASPPSDASMAKYIANFDWSRTPLGPSDLWPDSLKNTLRILLTSRFAMWMAWGPELTVLYNDSYARTTLGKKHPWALGKPAAEVWSEIWKDIGPLVDGVMRSGEASWDEALMLILERSGYPEETYHTFSYSPLDGPNGTIAGMLCVVIEDTVRVIGERQLGALSKLASELSNSISKADVFAGIERGLGGQKDLPCTLTYLFNAEGTELRLVAKTGLAAEHPAAAKRIEVAAEPEAWPLGAVMQNNRALTVENLKELFPEFPSGCWDTSPHRARLMPIVRQGQDKPLGMFISALNPYRDFNSSYNEFLDLLVGQIATAIANAGAYEEERRRAESLAELDRAKTAFFSNVSHELRTPLTLILGPIEDSLTEQEPPSASSVEMMHRNALRLLKLVNGLLDFVRIEAGRMKARYVLTDLSVLCAHIASVFRSAIERAGLRLVVECSPLPEPVYIDHELWEKIELNLLSNALKSTFEGEIRVSVSESGGMARFAVIDTGTGITEADQKHLFERFQRIEGAQRRSHEGSGIGLALVRELVDMHGGTIEVTSQIGRGTTFSILLPFGHSHLPLEHVSHEERPVILHDSENAYVQEAFGWLPGLETEALLPSEILASDTASIEKIDFETKKPLLLFADDNRDMRQYVTSLLGQRFHVVTVQNGRQAVDFAARQRPDLVLSDAMMPEMDGLELVVSLRKNPETRTIPIILLSARAGEDSRIEGLDTGADDYISKPFSARELVARIEAQLNMSGLRRQAYEHVAHLSREVEAARRFAWETLEHIPDAFCTTDRNFRITYLNGAAARLAENGTADHVGQSLWDLFPIFRSTTVEEKSRQAMEDRASMQFDQHFLIDGSERWFSFLLYPHGDAGIILYLRETTKTQKIEQALRGSEKLAAAGRLAASIAHEINNPLEAVTNLLFLAKLDGTITGNARGLLEVADRELQRLSHIAARSLKFYRQRTAPASTSIEELVESVLFFNEPDVRIRGIRLERRIRSASPVICLPGEIQQVITNIIANALDALAENGRLIVALRPSATANERSGILLTVADTGAGMERSTMERLFQPFVTTKGEAGTGLGLWVSKGIVDSHRGTIRVRSKRAAGTVFEIFLPLNATPEEAT